MKPVSLVAIPPFLVHGLAMTVAVAGSFTALATNPAHADVIPLTIDRSITVFGVVDPIEGDSGFDSDNTSFSDAGTFDDQLSAFVAIEDAEAQSSSFQTSIIYDDGSIFASGGFQAASSLGSSAEFAEALGHTQLHFRFTLDAITPTRIFGSLVATGNGVANLVLVGPGGALVNLSIRDAVESVDEDLQLPIGNYELSISTSGYGQALPEGEFPATGNFEISFAPSSPASVETSALADASPSLSPNPVTGNAEIRFRSGAVPNGHELDVVSANGRLVRSLGPVGSGTSTWDTRNDEGALVAAGVYFVRLTGTRLSARAVVVR